VVVEGLHRLPLSLHRWLPLDQRADLRHLLGRFHPGEDGFDLTPPRSRPGETTGPPDYVGVGATASGSAWWHRLLLDHPGVAWRPDLPPARHFLSHFAAEPFGPGSVARYHGWFPRRDEMLAGEWTPTYASFPWVAPLLAEAAPGARVLFMVRDPVARLGVALADAAERRVAQAGTATAEAIDGGCYGTQLRQLLRYVPAHRVLVLQYERCLEDRDGQLAATYRFLGLDDTYRPRRWPRPSPPRPAPVAGPLDPDTRDRLVALYADEVAELHALAPALDLDRWPLFADQGR
jgi:hypothetical protein